MTNTRNTDSSEPRFDPRMGFQALLDRFGVSLSDITNPSASFSRAVQMRMSNSQIMMIIIMLIGVNLLFSGDTTPGLWLMLGFPFSWLIIREVPIGVVQRAVIRLDYGKPGRLIAAQLKRPFLHMYWPTFSGLLDYQDRLKSEHFNELLMRLGKYKTVPPKIAEKSVPLLVLLLNESAKVCVSLESGLLKHDSPAEQESQN